MEEESMMSASKMSDTGADNCTASFEGNAGESGSMAVLNHGQKQGQGQGQGSGYGNGQGQGNLTMAQRLELWKAQKQQTKTIGHNHHAQPHNFVSPAAITTPCAAVINAENCLPNKKKNIDVVVVGSNSDHKTKRPLHTKSSENVLTTATKQENSNPNIQIDNSNSNNNSMVQAEKLALECALRTTQAELEHANVTLEKAFTQSELLRGLLEQETQKSLEAEATVSALEISQAEIVSRARVALEEAQALTFENSIQQQRITELEQMASRDRIEASELVTMKTRKHKEELQRLASEKQDYENRADVMIQEVNEQMAQLQHMAMERIEV
jgi:hypothetical protein